MSLQYDYIGRKARFSTDPGRLDRRVSLWASTVTRDAGGGESVTWAKFAEVWASRLPMDGTRLFSAEEKASLEDVEYRIRYRRDVLMYMQLREGQNTYEIIPPMRELGRAHFLELTCRAVNQVSAVLQTVPVPVRA